ncbi:MAG: UPF0149 family protein [Gammaproteobacteria bacterium]
MIDYVELNSALKHAGIGSDAAEVHGTLAGLLSANAGTTVTQFVGHIVEDTDNNDTQVAELSRQLRQLYAETQQNLYEGQMAFQPFLPHDDAPLVDRTDALALWCQGFLYGLSIGRGVAGQTSDDVREAIEDLAQIARAGVSDESDEDDEVAYVELVEFLRVGAQLIFEELNLAQSPPVPTSDTIH